MVADATQAGTGGDGFKPVHPEKATESAPGKLEGTGVQPVDDRAVGVGLIQKRRRNTGEKAKLHSVGGAGF